MPIYNLISDLTSKLSKGKLENDGKIKYCEVYSPILKDSNGDNVEYGCVKCKFGKYGKIKTFKVDKCKSYHPTEAKCSSCIEGYTLSSDGLICN